MSSTTISYNKIGKGPSRVLVLHDWYCDCTNWDGIIPYLNLDQFTYVFADLRGYGSSRKLQGEYTFQEAVGDVVSLLDRLGWQQFSLIGHSMSGLIVQQLAQILPKERIHRIVAVTPAPPIGLKCDQPTIEFFRSFTLSSDEERFKTMAPLWGSRLSDEWIRFKLRRWRKTASTEAALKYIEIWANTDITPGMKTLETPILIITGDHDAPPFKRDAIEKTMLPYYPKAELVNLTESGHYPMQEQPPLLATLIERFLT